MNDVEKRLGDQTACLNEHITAALALSISQQVSAFVESLGDILGHTDTNDSEAPVDDYQWHGM